MMSRWIQFRREPAFCDAAVPAVSTSPARVRSAIAVVAATLILRLAQTAGAVSATGGNVTNDVDGYSIHIFTNSATASNFVVVSGGSVEVLVVAGGGGGGQTIGGGGGAGGFILSNSYAVTPGTYTVIVGAGGAGAPGNSGTYSTDGGAKGSNSVFDSLIAYGGGGGGSYNQTANGATAGGSGGGMGAGRSGGPMAGTNGQGNAGGTTAANSNGGAGGGGAGTVGTNGISAMQGAGRGGAGLSSDTSGMLTWYAGGGGGGSRNVASYGSGGTGGLGGGGAGSNVAGTNGVANTGGGGGAGGFQGNASYAGGRGGSGIVIVRYVSATPLIENRPATNVTLVSASLNGYLSDTGLAVTTVSVYWGTSDQGTNKDLWANTNQFDEPWPAPVGHYSTNVVLGSPDVTYSYRYHASNAFGEVWSPTAASLVAGEVTVQATDASAQYPNDTGVFAISRPAAATNEAVIINLAFSGSATNGMDYETLATNVTLQAGVATTNLTLTPLFPPVFARTSREAVVTVLPGAYVVGSSSAATVTVTQVGSLTSWDKSAPITFSGYTPPGGAETLTNFPALLIFSNGAAGGGFQYADFLSPPYGDLRFVAPNQVDALNFDVERWDTNGVSTVWVQVPLLTSNTTIWAAWGKAATNAPPCVTNGSVWSNGFVGVWHMEQTNATDASRRGHDGSARGATTSVAGMIGQANSFTPNADYIVVPSSTDFVFPGDYSVSTWVYARSHPDYEGLMGTYNAPGFMLLLYNGQPHALSFWSVAYPGAAILTEGAWHLVNYTRQGTEGKFYIDGANVQTIATAIPITGSGKNLHFANGGPDWTSYGLDGILDEARIENVKRSPAWIWACYMNQSAPAQFADMGPILRNSPVIASTDTSDVTLTTATLNGYLSSTGGFDTAVWVYWGLSDGGTNKDLWANTNQFTVPWPGTVGAYSTNVALSVADTTYYYRYYASNSFADAWAPTAASFVAGAVTIQATDSSALESGLDTGTFTVSRPETATNMPLTVNVGMGGTAVNGYDYAWIEGSVIIPAGASNATITVTPIPDAENEPDETVDVTLLPGSYAVGTPSNATVTITEVTAPLTNIWSGTGWWTNNARWSCGFVPVQAQVVWVTNGSVILDRPTAAMTAFTLTNAVLTFTNWSTCLAATDVAILNKGVVTNVLCDTNAAIGNSNRVWIVCTNLTVAAGGAINVKGAGFRGGINPNGWGQGPGGGGNSGNGNGGGYGGFGGKYYSAPVTHIGQTYGSAAAPIDPGSGGGGASGGYAGGGAVRIDASGHVIINGGVNADGVGNGNYSYNGCGSGGGIYITCRTFAGTNGLVTADGGQAVTLWGYAAGGGGGGRIAVVCDSVAQSNLIAAVGRPTVSFWANPGQVGVPWGGPGTLWFTDDQLMVPVIRGGQFLNVMSWSTPSLMVSNGWAVFPTGVTLTVAGDFTVWGSLTPAVLTNPASVNVGGNLIVTNSASLTIYSLPTNGTADYGSLVSITDSLVVASGTAVYPWSDAINGGSILFRMSNLCLQAGSVINASGKGFTNSFSSHGYGPGRGQYNVSAGGYGGKGSGAATVGGTNFGWTYGSSNAPIDPGSSGGAAGGGAGGGLVRMEITNSALLAGSIYANGIGATRGGSGGGIFLQADKFLAAFGTLQADGGTGSSRGGGGGRIALTGWRQDNFDGVLSVVGGTTASATGEVGTIVRESIFGDWILTVGGDPVRHGVSSPYGYGSSVMAHGTDVTNTIPLTADESNGLRYICYQWSLTNSAGLVASGGPTQAVFTVETNLTLVWHWTNQYFLSTVAVTNGTLAEDLTGWYTNSVTVQVMAIPDGGCEFLQWAGSGVPVGHHLDNPLTLVMDRARDIIGAFVPTGSAVTRTWTGTNDWFAATNWAPVGIPAPGDSAILKSGKCSLSYPVGIASLLVSNGATLVVGTTNATLTATDVVVTNGGKITHLVNADTSAPWVMDNCIRISCTNLFVAAGGMIDANAVGYRGHPVGIGYGPGGGGVGSSGGGGGYGGTGGYISGRGPGGPTYGSPELPTEPGSGGGGHSSYADRIPGNGGGAIFLSVANEARVNGSIVANGGATSGGNDSGGGSGGSIALWCGSLAGTGTIQVTGGAANYGGGGAGGRIALYYTADPTWTGTVLMDGITGGGSAIQAQHGTLFVPDDRFFPDQVVNVRYRVYGMTNWAPSALGLAAANVSLEEDGIRLATPGDVLLNGSALTLGRDAGCSLPPALTAGGNLVLTGSTLRVYGADMPTGGEGAAIQVAGSLTLGNTSTLYVVSHPTNGASVSIAAGSMSVQALSTVNAYASGFRGGYQTNGLGPGGGLCPYHPGGGGYGGHGGKAAATGDGGITYGDSNAPAFPGSGGGGSRDRTTFGGRGGGFIWLTVDRTLAVDGTLNANGETMTLDRLAGGSGGGIHIRCKTITGSGTLAANGGSIIGTQAGIGGGGRIAVWCKKQEFSGTATAAKGTNMVGNIGAEDGTIVWGALSPGAVFLVH